MANYAYSPRGFEPTALETTFANQMSGPNANQLIGYLYSARMRGEQGNKEYQNTMLQTQAMANASAREKMQYDLAAALAGKNESLGMTTPGRSILAPGAEELAAAYSFAGLDKERAQAFRNFGAGADDFARAGAAPPMGSTYSLSGQPQEKLVQGEPLSIRLKNSGGSGSSTASGRLSLSEELALANKIEQYDDMKLKASNQFRRDLKDIANQPSLAYNAKAREAAIAARQAEHADTLKEIEASKQRALSVFKRYNVMQDGAAKPVAQTSTPTRTDTPAAIDVDRELAKARAALAKNAPRAEIEKVLKSRGVDPALLNAR